MDFNGHKGLQSGTNSGSSHNPTQNDCNMSSAAQNGGDSVQRREFSSSEEESDLGSETTYDSEGRYPRENSTYRRTRPSATQTTGNGRVTIDRPLAPIVGTLQPPPPIENFIGSFSSAGGPHLNNDSGPVRHSSNSFTRSAPYHTLPPRPPVSNNRNPGSYHSNVRNIAPPPPLFPRLTSVSTQPIPVKPQGYAAVGNGYQMSGNQYQGIGNGYQVAANGNQYGGSGFQGGGNGYQVLSNDYQPANNAPQSVQNGNTEDTTAELDGRSQRWMFRQRLVDRGMMKVLVDIIMYEYDQLHLNGTRFGGF